MDAAEAGFTKFTATSLDGTEINEALFVDYPLTMINVWGTFCGPCMEELPDLNKLHKEYQDKGFQVAGIVLDAVDTDGKIDEQQVELAREIAEKTGAEFTHFLPSKQLLSGPLYNVSAVPTTFFLDETGTVIGERYLGAKSYEDWKQIIEEKLKEVSK